jgi:hypothetical protein
MNKTAILATLALVGAAMLCAGCGGSTGCTDGRQPGLHLSTRPDSVEANGNEEIKVVITGLDADCNRLAAGTQVTLQLSGQEAENPEDDDGLVGQFANGETTTSTMMSDMGAQAVLTSTVAGTAQLTATAVVDEEMMTSLPVEVTFTSAPDERCAIRLNADPGSIMADGASTTQITATLVAYDGAAMPDGTEVTFTTNLGSFTAGDTQVTAEVSDGTASAVLRSEDLEQTDVATVSASFICDDPLGSEKNNRIDVPFLVGGEDPSITLSASANEILADGDSTVDLTAEVFLPDGTRAGAGQTVSFTTNRGTFTEAQSAPYDMVDVATDAEGKAYVTFEGGTEGGIATIVASVYINDRTARREIQINVRQVGFVEYVSASNEKLGVRGSGRNETSLVTFAVKDTNDQPFPNVMVGFTTSAPEVTLEPQQARTGADGRVSTTLKSGRTATSATVLATAQVGSVVLSAESPALAIVGAKPNAGQFSFSCETRNVGGFVEDGINTECTVRLADRYSNKIGFATNVLFRTEAGSIEGSAVTSDSGDDMGSATVVITTQDPRPVDVDPAAGEPFIIDGAYTRNPRDGLVTLIAYTTGEEWFDDVNGNGEYDEGEQFEDLGEPFIDSDDNGVWSPGDKQLIDLNGNEQWDGPNGQWDGDTQIWRPYWVVWTGHHAPGPRCGEAHRFSGLCPRSFSLSWQANQTQLMTWAVKDFNLNPLNETLNCNFGIEGPGEIVSVQPADPFDAQDALGTPISYVSVNDPVARGPCLVADPVCYMVPMIGAWGGGGFAGTVEIKSANDSPMNPDDPAGSVSMECSYDETGDGGARVDYNDSVSGQFLP